MCDEEPLGGNGKFTCVVFTQALFSGWEEGLGGDQIEEPSKAASAMHREDGGKVPQNPRSQCNAGEPLRLVHAPFLVER